MLQKNFYRQKISFWSSNQQQQSTEELQQKHKIAKNIKCQLTYHEAEPDDPS